jgi:hypothetical protein
MRRGDAQHRRAARLTKTADQPWSARAEPARVPREAPFLIRAKAQLSLGLRRGEFAGEGAAADDPLDAVRDALP